MAVTYVYSGVAGYFEFDFTNQEINMEGTVNTLAVQELLDACRTAEFSEVGLSFNKICDASGKEYLDPVEGIQVAITIQLLENWKIYSEKTSGSFKVFKGNLVREDGEDPFKPNPLVTEINIMAAAGTIVSVSTGSGLSSEEHNKLISIPSQTLEDSERDQLSNIESKVTQIKQSKHITYIK